MNRRFRRTDLGVPPSIFVSSFGWNGVSLRHWLHGRRELRVGHHLLLLERSLATVMSLLLCLLGIARVLQL